MVRRQRAARTPATTQALAPAHSVPPAIPLPAEAALVRQETGNSRLSTLASTRVNSSSCANNRASRLSCARYAARSDGPGPWTPSMQLGSTENLTQVHQVRPLKASSSGSERSLPAPRMASMSAPMANERPSASVADHDYDHDRRRRPRPDTARHLPQQAASSSPGALVRRGRRRGGVARVEAGVLRVHATAGR
jgi:hypothetical protein